MNRAQRIAAQLGMPQGTANHKLRKSILFEYVRRAGDNICYKCGIDIDSVSDLSIEHKEPWEGRDAVLFWSLDNIAFSHVQCNRPHNGPETRRTRMNDAYQFWCNRCKMWKEKDEFAKNASTWSGVNPRCTACQTEVKRELRQRERHSE